MQFLQKHRLFLRLSLLLALTASSFFAIFYFQLKQRLHAEEHARARGHFSAFNIAYEAVQENMLQVANVFAHTPEFETLFLKGKQAVEKEGGGPGREESQRARMALYNAVSANWQQLNQKFNARVLQFHLGPGSTSFLRVHKPQKYGDNMDTVRHTIVDTNAEKLSVKGFETGRVYSGIRGTSPVSVINESGELVHVGVVEAGVSFSLVLDNLLSEFDVNAAVLLSEEHLRENVWPDILQDMVQKRPLIHRSYIEQTTSDQIKLLAVLASSGSHEHTAENSTEEGLIVSILIHDDRRYLYATQALKDYRGSNDATQPDAGKVVIWEDITPMYAAFNSDLFTSLYYALGALFFIELLLFMAIRSVSNRLNSVIDQQNKHQQELELIAHYDPLTRLPNRTLFTERFNKAIGHSDTTNTLLAVCFLDLDHFKPINDNFGHDVGDKLLVEVAKRIQNILRDDDTVSRQGGDEFAILLSDVMSNDECMRFLDRIHASLAEPYVIDGQAHTVSASSGTTLYPLDDSDLDTLLRHADQAMYQSKLSGRNAHHVFNPSDDERFIRKQIKLQEIELALSRDELRLYYQPKVLMRTGEVFGVEALIRWLHPDKGLISPIEFLPIIEGTELEVKIGDWVISQALLQLASWMKHEIHLEVSVNISSHHLLSDAFTRRLEQMLIDHADAPAGKFQLELLESSALGDLQAIGEIIEHCQDKLNVRIALDDFGTGYSSLAHLRNLSANTIKIDQSFVKNMLSDPSDYSIIDGLIGLADAFNRDVIAEGVETTNHGIMLMLMGCNAAQGYGIARPMPARELAEWLKSYTPNEEWLHQASRNYSLQENKIELVRLTTLHWFDVFSHKLEEAQKTGISEWPYISHTKCHHGAWIKRVRKEQLFDENWLTELERDHEAMHAMAETLINRYQSDGGNILSEDIRAVQAAFNIMIDSLDAYLVRTASNPEKFAKSA
ncbi:MAG: EAL domain-containing protein [Granulosicoccus sp.]